MSKFENTLLVFLSIGILIGVIGDIGSSAKPRIVILANDIDFDLAEDFFGFLANKGIDTIRASASDFDQYKTEMFLVVLGGPDAYDGVGEIVSDILSEEEKNAIRQKGSRKMYVKINPWNEKPGQRVTVVAGSDRDMTKRASNDFRELIAQPLEGVEIKEEDVKPTSVTINIQIREYSPKDIVFNPYTVTITKGSTVTWVNKVPPIYTIKELNGTFESGPIHTGESFSFIFNEIGTYIFVANNDLVLLKGTVIVLE